MAVSNIIPPEIKNDDFYFLIEKLAAEEDVENILEIGSSSGDGSTEAFVKGLRRNKNDVSLFCMEISKERFANLSNAYKNEKFVKCYNCSSVPVSKLPPTVKVEEFYNNHNTALNQYPLDTVLEWLEDDLNYMSSTDEQNGIELIKKDNNIDKFDLALIDGSEFTGEPELELIYGAKIILLDDINAFKNYNNFQRLLNDSNYELVKVNKSLRNGYAYFRLKDSAGGSKNDSAGPTVHFFTIVLNGMPFIEYHFDVFNSLPFNWQWHIIEGVADLKHDTGWSLSNGAAIPDFIHNQGRSIDGTTEYLNNLMEKNPAHITVYRKNPGQFWDGKKEMVSAPLINIAKESLLWQIDVDEFWTAGQIIKARELFMQNPEKTAAYFLCNYFVGPKLAISSINTYGNNTSYEWLRLWKFKPDDSWISHEPPKLARKISDSEWKDLAGIDCFYHQETADAGLIFQHYAYVIEQQLQFKEYYYGYKNAVKQWEKLQREKYFPVFLRDYFEWVNDAAVVDTIENLGIAPIADFYSEKETKENAEREKLIFMRSDSIGDNVLAGAMLKPLKSHFGNLDILVVCQDTSAPLYMNSPFVDSVIPYNKALLITDENYRTQFAQRLKNIGGKILINSVYSRDIISDFLVRFSGAEEKIGFNGDLANFSPADKEEGDKYYTKLIETPSGIMSELKRYELFLDELNISYDSLAPELWIGREDLEFAEKAYADLKFNPDKTLIIYSSAQFGYKDYYKIGAAVNEFCVNNGFSVLALGDEKAKELNQLNLEQLTVPFYNLSGLTTIMQSAAILSKAGAAVGVDTGLAHFASAAGVPSVVILGGGHWGRFFPYSKSTAVVSKVTDCYNCDWKCSKGEAVCVKGINIVPIGSALEDITKSDFKKIRLYFDNAESEIRANSVNKFSVNNNCSVHFHNIENLIEPHSEAKKENSYSGLPKISIVTPSFNQAEYLEETILSVITQNYPNLEYIIIDGGSTDGSVEIIKKYEKYITYWISEKDAGQYDAINKGFAKSTGEIMGWINSDDFLHPNSLWLLAGLFSTEKDFDWISGRISMVNQFGKQMWVGDLQIWSREKYLTSIVDHIQQETTFWRRSLWEKAGGKLNTDYDLAADFELWIRFFRYAELKPINCLFASSRVHSKQRSQDIDTYNAEAQTAALKEIAEIKTFGDSDKVEPDVIYLNKISLTKNPPAFLRETLDKDSMYKIADDFISYGRISLAKSVLWNAVFIGISELKLFTELIDLEMQDNRFDNAFGLVNHCENPETSVPLNKEKVNVIKNTHKLFSGLLLCYRAIEENETDKIGGYFEFAVKNYSLLHNKSIDIKEFDTEKILPVLKQIYRHYKNLRCDLMIKSAETLFDGMTEEKLNKSESSESQFKVSAIVSTYNSEEFIEGCLEDLINQTIYKSGDLEIVVVNSGSEQNEDEIIREYAEKYKNINYIKTENRETIYEAWNRGIKAAGGRYVTNANTDDRHADNAYERMLKIFERSPIVDVVYSNVYKTTKPNDTFDSASLKSRMDWINYDKDLIHFGCFIGPQPMWKKSLHDKYGYFDESLKVVGDYEFWLRISQQANFYHIEEPLGLYLYSESSAEHRDNSQTNKENILVQNKYFIEHYKSEEDLRRITDKLEYVNNIFKNENYYKNSLSLIKKRRKGIKLEQSINELVGTFEDSPINAVFEAISNLLQELKSEDLLIDVNLQAGILYTLKGSCYLMNNQPDEAKRMFEIAVEYDPSNKELLKENAGKYSGQPLEYKDKTILDRDEFINTLRSALNSYQDNKFMDSLEILLSLEKSFDKKLASNSLKVKISEVKEMIGFCNLGIGDYENAHDNFKSALEYNPTSTYACSGLGKLFFIVGNNELSKSMYEWAVKNEPNNKFALEGLKTVNEILGYPPEHSTLEEGVISPKVEEAESLINQGNFQGAEEILDEILQSDTDCIPAINDLSVVKILKEEYHSAAKLINRVIYLDPSNRIAEENLNILEQIVNENLNDIQQTNQEV